LRLRLENDNILSFYDINTLEKIRDDFYMNRIFYEKIVALSQKDICFTRQFGVLIEVLNV
jgi:hypothetical protein